MVYNSKRMQLKISPGKRQGQSPAFQMWSCQLSCPSRDGALSPAGVGTVCQPRELTCTWGSRVFVWFCRVDVVTRTAGLSPARWYQNWPKALTLPPVVSPPPVAQAPANKDTCISGIFQEPRDYLPGAKGKRPDLSWVKVKFFLTSMLPLSSQAKF